MDKSLIVKPAGFKEGAFVTKKEVNEDIAARVSFVVENAQVLVDEIEKAQKLSSELKEALRLIENFTPVLRRVD